jgi:prolyl-tRNA synthetase
VLAATEKLKKDLVAAGFRVKRDTRDLRPGAKYYWWELRGVPLRVELGPRDLDAGVVTAVLRTGGKKMLSLANIAEEVTGVLAEVTTALWNKAEKHTRSHLVSADSIDQLNSALEAAKVAVVHWCGDRACGDAMEEKTNSSLLGTEVRSPYVACTSGGCIICGKPGAATLVGRAY